MPKSQGVIKKLLTHPYLTHNRAGIGQLAWQAIQRVDIPIIMAVTLVSAIAIVIGNLIADLIAPFVDPRIRLK
jgi:ABC-type dipeptide/oligopeptide/nickel transport system permease component